MLILQMTGLSGAGKTTLAFALKKGLEENGYAATVLDGDAFRKGACKDLGFSAADRRENIRRMALVADSLRQQGMVAILAAINPFEDIRSALRQELGARTIWVHCDLEVLIKRDTKGLYQKALLPDGTPGKIHNLTGVNDPYEIPRDPDLVIDTTHAGPGLSQARLLEYVMEILLDSGN
ncbi:MAG: adenylyl-sulfate kinase [Flavisolibacter sp.]